MKCVFFSWIPSVFVVQFSVQITKLNGLAQTYRKRICSGTSRTSLSGLQRKIVLENLDIKWMKIPQTNSIANNTSQF